MEILFAKNTYNISVTMNGKIIVIHIDLVTINVQSINRNKYCIY